MSATEFERSASRWRELCQMDRHDAVTAACRGSGNPAVLAWLAEALALDGDARVVDIGGGLGGPCAWLADRYGCATVSVDPVHEASRAATVVFGVPSAVADGRAVPFADGEFDAALLLGVLSVVDDRTAVLAEAGRVAERLGLIAYCSTGADEVELGGSRFATVQSLRDLLARAGWEIDAGPESPSFPPPPSWEDQDIDGDEAVDRDEEEVVGAIDDGLVESVVLTARRAPEPTSETDRPRR